ncbi:MAG: NHL repeat-containing protein, partial [Bryobacteraceae bacterium]|nr:NHL repeat-containing protein [Bryobacteraceae bacterium]
MIRSFAFLTAAMFAGNQASVFAQSVLNQTPSRVLGQPTLTIKSGSPNLPEGREFFNPYAVTVDKSTSPSPLFVSDYGNNRVLGWRDSTRFANGAPADLVIGQIDKSTTLALGPSTSRTIGLSAPTGIAVDATGNLYVIDAGNNRILRFPKPFAQNVDIPIPDFVIGQNSFTTNAANLEGLSANSIALNSNGVSRADLTFDAQGNLWFSDALNNRVLRYPAASLLAGPNRPAADIALGQTSLTTNTLPTGLTRAQQVLSKSFLSIPGGITFDSDNRLYVADNLGRVLVYLPPYSTGKDAARIVGLQVQRPNTQPQREYLLASPQALFAVGARLGVVDPAQNRITLYDAFPSWDPESEEFPSPPAKILIGQSDFNSFTANRSLAEPSETSLAQPFGAYYSGTELYVADTGNHRVLVYSQAVNNAAATRVLGQAAFN